MDALHHYVCDEYDGLRKLSVKFNVNTLQTLALHLLLVIQSDAYSANMVDYDNGKTITSQVT